MALKTRLTCDREIVGLVAEQREPARMLHHEIELVAMDDEVAPSVGAVVDGVLDHLDAAEMRAVKAAQEFVVIARHVDDARALARLAQELLHHVVVRLRPVPAGLERPAVDDVADQVDRLGVVVAQEVEQRSAWQPAGAEMHIGDEQCAKIPRTVAVPHDRVPVHVSMAQS